MARLVILTTGLFLLVSEGPGTAVAQTGSLFGGSAPNSITGRSGAAGGVGSTGNFGTLGLGGSGFGAQSSTGFGAAAQGGMPFASVQGAMPFATAGMTPGPGFAGGIMPQGFAGGTQPMGMTGGRTGGVGQFGMTGRMGVGQTQFGGGQFGMGGFQRNFNRGDNFQNQGMNSRTNNQQPQIIVRSQVAFPVPERTPGAVANRLETRFDRISERGPQFANIAFEPAAEGEVVLRGTVPTEDARRLAAALTRLEPGVRAVRNELVVAAPGPSP